MAEAGETVVPLNEFHAFVIRVMCAVGVQESDANSLADLLVSADYRGHYSHGLNRLGKFPFHLSCYPSEQTVLGHYRPTSETPLMAFADEPVVGLL